MWATARVRPYNECKGVCHTPLQLKIKIHCQLSIVHCQLINDLDHAFAVGDDIDAASG